MNWKSPLWSWSPIVNPTLPTSPLNPKWPIFTFFEHFQGWWLWHCPGQMLQNARNIKLHTWNCKYPSDRRGMDEYTQQWVGWHQTRERQGWWENYSSLMMKIGLEQQKQIQVSRETPETKNMQNKKQFCPLYAASTSSSQPLGSTQKTSSQIELRRRFKLGGSDTTNHPAVPCAPPWMKATSYACMAQAAENFNPSPDGSTGKHRRKHQQA